MKLSRGILMNLFHSSIVVALVSTGLCAIFSRTLMAADPYVLTMNSAEVPKPALDLIKSMMDELVLTGELPTDQAREKGNAILAKYFTASIGQDFLMEAILENAAPEMEPKPDLKAIFNPQGQQAKLEKAMAKAFFREATWRIFLNMVRSIREVEKSNLADAPIFFDEGLKLKLLSNALTFATENTAREVYRMKSHTSDYFVRVKLMPEVQEYGKSVDIEYVVRRSVKENYAISDVVLFSGIRAVNLYHETMTTLVIHTAKTGNMLSDLIHSREVIESMKKWGIDEAKWKALAQELTE